uniref:Uncharacterized protein n=1 Tax=Nelumbo nucifera TaxID=4432 RepID=A0A822XJ48_NELNU|nr:TPA_asm: hypothetical protein HUJ06_020634 [Nelumbo nucifera]
MARKAGNENLQIERDSKVIISWLTSHLRAHLDQYLSRNVWDRQLFNFYLEMSKNLGSFIVQVWHAAIPKVFCTWGRAGFILGRNGEAREACPTYFEYLFYDGSQSHSPNHPKFMKFVTGARI